MKIFFSLIFLVACQMENSALKSAGGASNQLSWFKTPDEIWNTIDSWKLDIISTDRQTYYRTLGELYGLTNLKQQESLLVEPNGTYLLALDVLSTWLSDELIEKQEHEDENFMFRGGLFTSENPNDVCDEEDPNYCYKNNQKDWCDCRDGVKLGKYAKNTTLHTEAEHKKRIMHNIQDVGDFLGVPIDNLLITKNERHAALYLYEEVFLPKLEQKEDNKPKSNNEQKKMSENSGDFNSDNSHSADRNAWLAVVHAILMSGPFYMNIDTRE